MGFIKEFKEFALKGNLVDMAIAFVMGGAFGKVTTAFVEKMFSPIVGLLMGGIDLSKKKLILKDAAPEIKDAAGTVVTQAVQEVAIEWGTFITACIDFLIVAFAMFIIIKAMNSMKKKEAEAPTAPPAPSKEEVLLTEIRDALRNR
ncbi:MAG: large-conductance mechanosensitive channel protein MscL [Cytophagales bacterium]